MSDRNSAATGKENLSRRLALFHNEGWGNVHKGSGVGFIPLSLFPSQREGLSLIHIFVAKAGFLLQAVIMPYDVISQQFVDNLKRLTEQCVLSLDLREREKALARAAEPEQFSLNVDPATGEIVGGNEGEE